MKKRIPCVLITCFILLCTIGGVQATTSDSIQIVANQVMGNLNEEVSVAVILENPTQNGFVSGIWEYQFNPLYLQCTEVEEKTILEQAYTTVHIDNENGSIRIVGIESIPNTQSGNIAVLHFTIRKDTIKSIPVTVQVLELKDKEGNTIPTDITQQGSVIIQNPSEPNPMKGDVNQDGKVSLYDAFKILEQAILGGNITEQETYIMDYNDDGKVALYDAFKFLEIAILG